MDKPAQNKIFKSRLILRLLVCLVLFECIINISPISIAAIYTVRQSTTRERFTFKVRVLTNIFAVLLYQI